MAGLPCVLWRGSDAWWWVGPPCDLPSTQCVRACHCKSMHILVNGECTHCLTRLCMGVWHVCLSLPAPQLYC